MFSPIVVDVIDHQKHRLIFSATLAFTTVGFKHLSSKFLGGFVAVLPGFLSVVFLPLFDVLL